MRVPTGLFCICTAIQLLANNVYAQVTATVPWRVTDPAVADLDPLLLRRARDYALQGGGSGIIIYRGQQVLSWGDQRQKYDLKSTTKSFGATALGIGLKDGRIDLNSPASKYHPYFLGETKSDEIRQRLRAITILQLATQTSGFDKPGGSEMLLFAPGSKWHYSDSGPNWLAECLTYAYQRDLQELMFERVFGPMGITPDDLSWRQNQYREKKLDGIERREFGSGIHANVQAMARLGILYLHDGKWNDRQILPAGFATKAGQPIPQLIGLPEQAGGHGNASDHYGLLWWNNGDQTLKGVPKDAYWTWGLYDSLIFVVPSLDLVVARAGKSFPGDRADHYAPLRPFFEPICAAIKSSPKSLPEKNTSKYVPRIKDIKWAPIESIVRRAEGSDNWPLTWADDDLLYGAYGDGWGFEPRVEKKLSMGFASISGSASDFRGSHIRTSTGEFLGDARGRKASGILMVDGILYVWTRNVGNSHLGWSRDHGKTWEWADWKFTDGFAAPSFLNFGKNYADAVDEFVYIYSFDSDSAYEAADRMNLARVHKSRLTDRDAYEFFVELQDGTATWTTDIQHRGAVFEDNRGCYRSHVSYNSGLDCFLWVQIKGTDDTRFRGGLGIYESNTPWGPWHEVYYAERWDVGPGDSASFPTKWISSEGRRANLVFSGDDCFSVRQATFVLNE